MEELSERPSLLSLLTREEENNITACLTVIESVLASLREEETFPRVIIFYSEYMKCYLNLCIFSLTLTFFFLRVMRISVVCTVLDFSFVCVCVFEDSGLP